VTGMGWGREIFSVNGMRIETKYYTVSFSNQQWQQPDAETPGLFDGADAKAAGRKAAIYTQLCSGIDIHTHCHSNYETTPTNQPLTSLR